MLILFVDSLYRISIINSSPQFELSIPTFILNKGILLSTIYAGRSLKQKKKEQKGNVNFSVLHLTLILTVNVVSITIISYSVSSSAHATKRFIFFSKPALYFLSNSTM